MRSFINIIFYIGFLFFGGGFLIAFGQFILYNGVGQCFTYVKADNAQINYEITHPKQIEKPTSIIHIG